MAFVCVGLASQDVSRRHNEAVSNRHRPRLTNIKSVKASPYPKGPQETSQPVQLLPSGDVTIDEQFYQDSPREVITGSEDLSRSDSIPSLYLSDDQLNEYCNNNNNDHLYNINNLSNSYCNFGVPVQSVPPSLIKWPLDNCIKSKRIADIRQQVKLLSRAIKMTMDSDHAETAAGDSKGKISPFSLCVNVALIRSHIDSSSGSSVPLPDIGDLKSLLETGKIKEAKGLIRESSWGINHSIRESLWKMLSQRLTLEQFSDTYYWDTVQQIFGTKDLAECLPVLPAFLDQRQMASHGLSDEGIKACHRVLAVISFSYPGITYAPIMYSIAVAFIHYMDEPETYNCLAALINKGSSFIPQTKILNECMWRTVLALSKKHVRGSYFMLSKYGVSEDQINDGFKEWSRWIFNYIPISHMVRVMDCFLLEGTKVLLRCSMALFHMFMKSISRDPSLAASLTTKGFSEAIALFCQNLNRTPMKLLKTSFGIRALSKTEIKKILTQSELLFKSQSGLGSEISQSANRAEGLPNLESQDIVQLKSRTLAVKELLLIWGWLPLRMTMQHPTLIYTTEEHGSSLRTFHNKVDQYEPTLLIIRTTNDYVFGAYCSTAWGERTRCDEYGNRQTYFGTGETFLFSLRPKPVLYEWVGILQQRQDSMLSNVQHSEQLYMHADADMIAIGGGHGHGLTLEHDFQSGRTERCETFNNPPLCPDEHFSIKVVEVYGLSQN